MGRNLTRVPTEVGVSASAWKKVKPLYKVMKNWACFVGAFYAPAPMKPWMYRRLGLKIGKKVQIMPGFATDIFFPELISIGDNSVIGMDTFFSCHEFTVDEFKYGPIKVGKNVLIGARSFILPGVTIGDGAIVSAQTLIYKDVPAHNLAFGSPLQFRELGMKPVPAKKLKKKK